jgi:hypothetical protein
MSKIKYEFGGIHFNYLWSRTTEVQFDLPIKLTNNSNIGGEVTDFRATIRYGNLNLLQVSLPILQIPANGIVTRTVSGSVDVVQLGLNVPQFIQAGSFLNKLFIVGSFQFMGQHFTIDEPIKVL